MPIRGSSATDIRPLIESLSAPDEIRRETAIARLAIIGVRAVDRLTAAYAGADGDRAKRIAILRVLEAVGDARGGPVAREALHHGGDEALAAAGVLRALLDSPVGGAAADALDALVAVALDRQVERRVRMAAFDALQDMPDEVRAQVATAVADDPDAAVKARATSTERDAPAGEAVWQDAIEGRLPDDPASLREAAHTRATSSPLSAIQKLVDALRARESAPGHAARRHEWLAVRGALHQALALRASTVAVYDLRETVAEASGSLPTTFLTALHVIGDESCLEAIAIAYTRAAGTAPMDRETPGTPSTDDERWRHQLAGAFQAIVKREKIARTSSVLKRIATKWPGASRAVSTTSRTTPRRKTPDRT
ncbi:MAG TPA: hypothetical protein VNJ03_11030 [Vicinamibacterales bacterium]|nr:hypothetical protein [Vicinamibacterales bacterium]